MKVKRESEVAQSCPTLSDPMDCSLPGSSIHGIFQARVLEWGLASSPAPDSTRCEVLLDLVIITTFLVSVFDALSSWDLADPGGTVPLTVSQFLEIVKGFLTSVPFVYKATSPEPIPSTTSFFKPLYVGPLFTFPSHPKASLPDN